MKILKRKTSLYWIDLKKYKLTPQKHFISLKKLIKLLWKIFEDSHVPYCWFATRSIDNCFNFVLITKIKWLITNQKFGSLSFEVNQFRFAFMLTLKKLNVWSFWLSRFFSTRRSSKIIFCKLRYEACGMFDYTYFSNVLDQFRLCRNRLFKAVKLNSSRT